MKNQVWDSYHNIKRIICSDLNSSEKLVLISIATNCEFDTKSRNYISERVYPILYENINLCLIIANLHINFDFLFY